VKSENLAPFANGRGAGLVGRSQVVRRHDICRHTSPRQASHAIINTSPEPFSYWVTSISEEAMVFSGLWLALHHPARFLMLPGLFVLQMLWLLPKLWRDIEVLR
jgi:Domain of unknown function (DUF4126)